MDLLVFEKKKLEYTAAQEMIRHYDTINWQIVAIFVAATLVLTGFLVQESSVNSIRTASSSSYAVVFGIPLFSYFILGGWLLWFKRHRDLYNYRNETLHRLEIELGFYHHLRVIEAAFADNKIVNKQALEILYKAKKTAHHSDNMFTPFFHLDPLIGPSGYTLAKYIAFGLPILQLGLLLALKFL
jgi:hypothetical protein